MTKIYKGTFANAELYQMAYALQCHLGVDEEGDLDALEGIEESDPDISALRKIWDLNPGYGSLETRSVDFTEDELDGLSEALSSHIAETEDLTKSDLVFARSAQVKCETRP